MINSLHKLFNKIELSWIDNYNEIANSPEYSQLISIFPNLKNIFQIGIQKDKDEYHRTLRHIFRLFKIFFLILDGKFLHDTLTNESIISIREKVMNQQSLNELIIPIVLMYHDIGRLEERKEHPYYSYKIIAEKKLLNLFELSDIEGLLIKKTIQYHLLFATIYTGESTFYGIYSLLNDSEFEELLDNKQNIKRFIDLLEIFTYIDILGYSYARIYDHYIKYYNEINNKLINILNLWPEKENALRLALEYSQEWIEWRIAGALRIFQYIETKTYLTRDFYFRKIRESIDEDIEKFFNKIGWKIIKERYLINCSKIQVKYGLAMLMLLAFGEFFRGPISKDAKISSNLIIFWILLSEEIKKRSSEDQESIWNIHFLSLPNWRNWDRKFKNELNYHTLSKIIKQSRQEFDDLKKEFNLYLDFKSVFY
ncbi:MAG: hypothetical protein ACFE8B_04220 [Candidatus Hermodarchaeota archaeon]